MTAVLTLLFNNEEEGGRREGGGRREKQWKREEEGRLFSHLITCYSVSPAASHSQTFSEKLSQLVTFAGYSSLCAFFS